MPNNTCSRCHAKKLAESIDPKKIASLMERDNSIDAKIERDQIEEAEKRAARSAIRSVLLTTETFPQDLQILERVEIVTAECAFGMNIFKDLFASVRDIVGGRSEAVQKTMRDARRTVLYELKKEAYEVGANAVIGVDLDYVELSAGANMVLLVGAGTAVKLAER
jgi:uncharacterized protein YbjQ (UPF0145 family)